MENVNFLVSIIVPVYNAEKTIQRCINSLLNQTYKNFEIIVINDGSKDKTLEKISKFTDERLKVFIQENKGISATRNIGVSKAQGEFIAFCDADDFYEPNYLEETIKLFDKKVCMVACDYTRKVKSVKSKKNIKEFSILQAKEEIFCDKYLYGYLWNKVLRKEIINKCHFDENVSAFGEDLIFLWDYLLNCEDEQKVVYTNQKLYHYIITKGSASSLKIQKKKFDEKRLNIFIKMNDMINHAKKLRGGGYS